MRDERRARMPALVLVVIALWTGDTQATDNPYGALSVPFVVEQLPNRPVYYVMGSPGVPGGENNGHTSNAGFVVTDEGVVVYDCLGTPALGYELLRAIRERTDKPVRLVIAGHYHADHIYGLQAFAEYTGAEIWAHRLALDYVGDKGDPAGGETARLRLEQRREALFPWVDENTYVVAPHHTFDLEKNFRLGDVEFLVRHMGPAHSPSDSILVVPTYGVVFSGDLVYEGRVPFLDSPFVNTESWVNGLEYLRAMDPRPEFLIPGHGPISTKVDERIAFTSGYINYLRAEMGKAAEEMLGFDEAYREVDWSDYRALPAFEESNRRNAYRVFLEMEAQALE